MMDCDLSNRYGGEYGSGPNRCGNRRITVRRSIAARWLFAVALCAAAMLEAGAARAAQAAGYDGQTRACSALERATIENTRISSAEAVPAGTTFNDPGGAPVQTTTAVCRVVATVSTQSAEQIGIEVWLPLGGWNGRLLGVGSGGFGGAIVYSALVPAVARGFVAANTDTGHRGGAQGAIGQPLSWAQNPVQLRDWGHTSIHWMTVAAKAITRAYYGQAPARSYYSGCSTGGAEAMEEAEFFPEDYDGVHAGSPGMHYSHLMESFLWGALLPAKQPAARLTPSALATLNQAVLQHCGGTDAASDGFLANPLTCHFDPARLQCKAGEDPAHCLSAAQVQQAQRLYSPVLDPRTGRALYPGFARGSESQWALIQGALVPNYAQPLLANTVFDNPDWDWTTFDFAADADRVDAVLSPNIDAMSPDLSRFRRRGGKLIMTQGWADALNAQTLPIEYFEEVANEAGGVRAAQSFYRLVMAPGMSHCGGGPGPNTVGGNLPPVHLDPERDVVSALQAWVEQGRAPESFVSTKYVNDDPASGVQFERPVCVYPDVPRYKGHGDRRFASSFACVPGPRLTSH
jgi:feruloyl esterase